MMLRKDCHAIKLSSVLTATACCIWPSHASHVVARPVTARHHCSMPSIFCSCCMVAKSLVLVSTYTDLTVGVQVPPNYDSLLGKLIVWGEDRPQAINRMRRALNEMVIAGVPTTAMYHTMILDIDDFQAGNVDTGFIPKHADDLDTPPPEKKVPARPILLLECRTMA